MSPAMTYCRGQCGAGLNFLKHLNNVLDIINVESWGIRLYLCRKPWWKCTLSVCVCVGRCMHVCGCVGGWVCGCVCVCVFGLPSVISARLVSTLPSMNLATASRAHVSPLTMDTLKRKSSWTDRGDGAQREFMCMRKKKKEDEQRIKRRQPPPSDGLTHKALVSSGINNTYAAWSPHINSRSYRWRL